LLNIIINKILIPKAWGVGSISKDWIKPFIVQPNSCCTETYLVIGPFDDENIAKNEVTLVDLDK
jgi:site-specific DNA-methyltransferase (adenine-specific)